MKEVSIIGVDLAKNVFQLHGAAAGRVKAENCWKSWVGTPAAEG